LPIYPWENDWWGMSPFTEKIWQTLTHPLAKANFQSIFARIAPQP